MNIGDVVIYNGDPECFIFGEYVHGETLYEYSEEFLEIGGIYTITKIGIVHPSNCYGKFRRSYKVDDCPIGFPSDLFSLYCSGWIRDKYDLR